MSTVENVNGTLSSGEDVNIHDIIREREAERIVVAKQKRLEDLKLIQDQVLDMKASTGVHPGEIVFEEIWSIILEDKELNLSDRVSAWNAHPFLRQAMGNTGIRDVLLPRVFEITKVQQCVDPLVDVRLISKSMRDGFDSRMEELFHKKLHESLHMAEERERFSDCVRISHDPDDEQLNKMLSSFQGDNPAVRFPSRELALDLHVFLDDVGDEVQIIPIPEERFSQFKGKMVTLLNTIGPQIWYFECDIDIYDSALLGLNQEEVFWRLYNDIRHYLHLLPNLRWLRVAMWCENTVRYLPQMDSFPHMQSLERATFEFKNGTVSCDFIEPILRANSHVKMLDLTGINELNDTLSGFNLINLVKTLSLNSLCLRSWRRERDYFEPELFFNFDWNLKTIALVEGLDGISAFQWLGRFPSLERVKLDYYKGIEHGNFLVLPNLTYIELEILDLQMKSNISFHFLSLQALVHCKNLKKLLWTIDSVDDVAIRNYLREREGPNLLDFRAGLRNIYDSNIWKVFPYLNSLDVSIEKNRKFGGNGRCTHHYKREALGQTRSQFLDIHGCCRNQRLHNCVVLQE